jgi:UDP-N-acetylmuramyl pentapeptide synthase
MLKMIKSSGRKVAVLGDMRELGEQAKPDHQKLAQVAAQTADVIILVGPLAHRYCWQYLRGTDFPAHRLFSFPQAYAAAAVIPKIIQEHDLLLIKGSQNTIFLEIIVKALMLEPQKASSLLCRQTPYWEAQRQKLIEQPFLTK